MTYQTMTTQDYMTYGNQINFTPLAEGTTVIMRHMGVTRMARLISVSPCGEWAKFMVKIDGGMWVEHSISRMVIGAKFLMGNPVLIEYRNGFKWQPITYDAVIQ